MKQYSDKFKWEALRLQETIGKRVVEVEQERRRAAILDKNHHGAQGSSIPRRDNYKHDHALISWGLFWGCRNQKARRENPQIHRALSHHGRSSRRASWHRRNRSHRQNLVIVSRADAFHRGIGYGDTPENAFTPDEIGAATLRSIASTRGRHSILEEGDYWGYNQHCVQAKSDARDTGQLSAT